MDYPKACDAVKVPVALMGRGSSRDRGLVAATIAIAHLGMPPGTVINVTKPMRGYRMARLLPKEGAIQGDDCELFRTEHPLAGEFRHAWVDRGDGVLLGYLKPEAIALLANDPNSSLTGVDVPDGSKIVESIKQASKVPGLEWLESRVE